MYCSEPLKETTHCVFIARSLAQTNAIVERLISHGLDAKGERFPLGEWGILVTFPWEGCAIPRSKLERLTNQIEVFVAELPAGKRR